MADKEETKAPPETLEIEHRAPVDLRTQFANGVIVTGTDAGIAYLNFYLDSVSVESETASKIGGDPDNPTYRVLEGGIETKRYREDVARVAIDRGTAESLVRILTDKLGLESE